MGGASGGFAKEGFKCTGIDIVDVGYPYELIVSDMRRLKGEHFQGYDVIWGSPPCRDFSNFTACGWKTWKKKPDVNAGLELVHCYLDFVKAAKPDMWIMENVPRLRKFLHSPPNQVSRIGKTMRRAFWGNYPNFLMPMDLSKPSIYYHNWKRETRAWERAKIPLPCSQAFAKACKEALTNKHQIVPDGTLIPYIEL